MRRYAGELGAAGVGRLVDPVGGQAAGEHLDRGVLAAQRDERLVAMTTAGHRDVQVPHIGRPVQDEEGVVDGASLSRRACGRVAELDVLGDVTAGKSHSP